MSVRPAVGQLPAVCSEPNSELDWADILQRCRGRVSLSSRLQYTTLLKDASKCSDIQPDPDWTFLGNLDPCVSRKKDGEEKLVRAECLASSTSTPSRDAPNTFSRTRAGTADIRLGWTKSQLILCNVWCDNFFLNSYIVCFFGKIVTIDCKCHWDVNPKWIFGPKGCLPGCFRWQRWTKIQRVLGARPTSTTSPNLRSAIINQVHVSIEAFLLKIN